MWGRRSHRRHRWARRCSSTSIRWWSNSRRALTNLDNFEALAFGPSLPDGRRTLLVMSDDNFRATQNTVFVWLGIEER